MKILCPTDFSAPSRDGVEFAARLAADHSGNMTLFHVRPTIWPEAMQLRHEIERSDEDIHDELELFRSEVVRSFSIPCDCSLDRTTATLQEAIAQKAEAYDLVVMGTNGADDLYQHAFGSNTYQVINTSRCPVLLVPEGTHYSSITRMVYAYDPDLQPFKVTDQLKSISKMLHLEGVDVHFDGNHAPTDKWKSLHEILDREIPSVEWKSTFRKGSDVADSIDSYMRETGAELLAISYHYRNVVQRLFRPNVIKRISMIAGYPVLVIHHG